MSQLVNDSNTVHIALATYPQNQSLEYVEDIKRYYSGFKERLNKHLIGEKKLKAFLYEPLIYHMFGNYDVAFISPIDSFKFAQKIFLPKTDDCCDPEINGYNPNSYQVLTGICLNEEKANDLEYIFENVKTKKFVGIINLKLNNFLHIGNGQDFIEEVVSTLIKRIKKTNGEAESNNYIINQSFSWFEISLIYFVDDYTKIPQIITDIRGLSLKSLKGKTELASGSLYNSIFPDQNLDETHLFVDTNSYFGLKYDEFKEGKLNDENTFRSEVEWQIKPGHFNDVKKILESINLNSNSKEIYNLEKGDFLLGKSDYQFKSLTTGLESNFKIFDELRNKESKLKHYVKRIRTKPLFDQIHEKSGLKKDTLLDVNPYLKKLSFCHNCVEEIEDFLIHLKISRQIREKIVKIYFNYNSGILDKVLFSFFLDFTVFLNNLTRTIITDFLGFQYNFLTPEEFDILSKDLISKSDSSKEKCNWNTLLKGEIHKFKTNTERIRSNSSYEAINDLETKYKTTIQAFEEGYHLRMLNGYTFEEMFDLDVDFNSSIQQLLTSYNTIVSEVSNNYYTNNYQNGMLVQLNLQNTVSNEVSINYNVHHLTSPEFVFFTIEKEILNAYISGTIKANQLIQEIETEILPFLAEKKLDQTLIELLKNKRFDVKYLIIDYFRIINSCNLELDLFVYWFWTYNLQNSSLYLNNGMLNEKHFENELFRLLLVVHLIDPSFVSKINCVIPELFSLWNRHYQRLNEASRCLIKELKEHPRLEKNIIDEIKQMMNEVTLDTLEEKGLNQKDTRLINFFMPKLAEVGENTNMMKKRFSHSLEERFFIQFEGGFAINSKKSGFKRHEIEELISTRKTPFFFAYIYAFLKFTYNKNNGKVRLLRRNWNNGKPITEFLENDVNQNFLYYTEQFGGTFHPFADSINDYFKMKNGVIQSIFHLASLKKKDFIIHHINN